MQVWTHAGACSVPAALFPRRLQRSWQGRLQHSLQRGRQRRLQRYLYRGLQHSPQRQLSGRFAVPFAGGASCSAVWNATGNAAESAAWNASCLPASNFIMRHTPRGVTQADAAPGRLPPRALYKYLVAPACGPSALSFSACTYVSVHARYVSMRLTLSTPVRLCARSYVCVHDCICTVLIRRVACASCCCSSLALRCTQL